MIRSQTKKKKKKDRAPPLQDKIKKNKRYVQAQLIFLFVLFLLQRYKKKENNKCM